MLDSIQEQTAPTPRAHPARAQSGKNLKTFVQFARDHQAFQESTLRWLRFCSVPGRKTKRGEDIPVNGFAAAFVKVGRRVYIDEDKFFELLHAQANAPLAAPDQDTPPKAPKTAAARAPKPRPKKTTQAEPAPTPAPKPTRRSARRRTRATKSRR